ncbi:CCR4-NOT transcription complex subunit 10-B-like [Phoenix dactylifera]|uniref:CCR4-NOT transcription complex subunit 10-B-like n=1 Tax=Phoenix dactylifera TaxID=42345 RepID=A0A8B9AM45_PHODC|nr:CCR4-NOT transcription complex subunit 10-B-like [Phoenix dactylifera]
MVRGRDLSTELLLKSQLEYARGNHHKAIKLLDTISNRTEPVMLSMYNNNIGCILHQQRSHHTSNWFFNKALRHSLLLRSEKPLKLAVFSQDRFCLIVHNCGLQHLVCGKPLAAARFFRQVIPVFGNRPLFWLRFAECCLLLSEKGLLGGSSSGEEIKVHVAGSGKWQQLVVNNVNSRSTDSDSIAGDAVTSGDDQILISLPFARQCLLNAQLLLDTLDRKMTKLDATDFALEAADPNQKLSSDSKASNSTSASTTVGASCDPQETNGGTGANTTLQILVAGYEVMGRKENQRIRQAVLGDLAYVALCLEDPLKALVAARSLQQLPDCSKMYLFLSYVYAAESLCRLNQPIEAAEQLSVFVTDGRNVELPYTNEDTQKWSDENGADCGELNGSATAKTAVEGTKKTMEESQDMGFLKPEKARGVLYVNLAAISAMQGVLEQASHFVKQGLSSLPNNPRVLLAAAYVDLLQGKAQEALVKLRKCRRIRYLSTNVTISS